MDIHEKNRVIFQAAKQYLEQNANPQKCQRYLAKRDIHSLEDAFEVAVRSINDQTMLGGVIGYGDGKEGSKGQIIKRCLFDLDYKKVYEAYGDGKTDKRYEKLYRCFREAIESNGEDSENNSWNKYAKNVCAIAAYISRFDSVDDMLKYFNRAKNADERIALADEIAKEIPQWGFKMACNWLKDIGINGFAKPDNVLSYIFTNLGLAEKNDKLISKAINQMAEDNHTPTFTVDMVFWLIGNSTASVIKDIERKNGKNKEDFVNTVLSMTTGEKMRNIDKFRGCLIGGAAGDALGYAVEFKREDEIFSEYGKDGITEYDLILDDDVAEISDDTQMTLFTAEGMLLAVSKSNIPDYISSIRKMYQCWYQTQSEVCPVQDEKHCSRLMRVPELFHRRCPGTTCMTEIKAGANGTVEVPINDSKGCGGVMRVAPIGLYFTDTDISYEYSDMLAAEAAALTHGHDLGFIPAAALAHIVRAVTESDIPLKAAINDSIAAMKKLFPKAEHISEFTAIMQKAVQLAETEQDNLSAIHQLGEGWVAEETLAIAVYCALRYENDFDMALRTAVNHNGDSDSTGAVCGNILGAYIGYNAIPQKYKERLELHDLICEISDMLCKE